MNKKTLWVIGLAWTFCVAAPMSGNQPSTDALSAAPALERQDASTGDAAATFDLNGPHDNDGLVKSPGDPITPLNFDPDAPAPDAPSSDGEDGEGGDPRGGPPPANDVCQSATVIPSNTVTYNPLLLNTTGASVGSCEGQESCESGGAGISNSVWYHYAPIMSGTVTINTFGSNYNTVLSVFTGSCGFLGIGGCLDVPTQIVCNDDYPFGTTSQVTLHVTAGQTYKIKVADYNTTDGGGTLDFNLFWAPANDNCADATIIPKTNYQPPSYSTNNASTDLCENDETCELNDIGTSNSVWYAYTAACDGFINVNTNGSTYDTVLSVWDKCGEFFGVDFPCNHPDPAAVELACDDDSGTGTQSQLTNVSVDGGQTYLIKVSDYNTTNGGGILNFNFLFTPGNPPVAAITSPAAFACVCGSVTVQGTASASGALVSRTLDYQSVGGASWTLISSGTNEITNGTLGTWNTAGLPQGDYLLRLTVQNECGVTDTAVTVVFVDAAFDSFNLDAPQDTAVVAGLTCVEGTVWDRCFDSYTVMYRPLGGLSFTPVDAGNPVYNNTVTTNPLAGAGWDTSALSDGDYELRVEAADQCGHPTSVIRAVTVDNTLPTAIITSPISCTSVDGVVQVSGTADDAHLGGWSLQVTDESQNGWTTIASGDVPVINDVLGLWDTTGLPDCAYTLRLIVTDDTPLGCGPLRNQAEDIVSVSIGEATGGSCCDVNDDGLSDGADVEPFVNCLLFDVCP